jgi:hypothetical protein
MCVFICIEAKRLRKSSLARISGKYKKKTQGSKNLSPVVGDSLPEHGFPSTQFINQLCPTVRGRVVATIKARKNV